MKKNGEELSVLELYFSIQYYENNKLITDELIENGNNTLVTSNNLDNYIEKRIEYLIKTQKNSVELIKKGFNSIIPLTELKIFNSDQLSLLINGTPFIDIDDWRLNTIYKNYNEYDNVIINFWEILSNLTQNDLSNFLLFCTGSSRVPIGGFKTLESNRGNVSKFCITKCEYISNQKNFIRAHTCFNRLDLPNFPNREKIKEAIKFAIENETLGFGID
jgi:E3 ubiquitin-protein ligase HUWE1